MSYAGPYKTTHSSVLRRQLQATTWVILAALLGFPAMAQAELVSQISNTSNSCGGFYQGQDYKGCKAGEISISSVTNVTFVGNPTECSIGDPLTIATATVNYEINTGTRNDLQMWLGNEQGTDPRLNYDGTARSCSTFSVPSPFTTPPTAGSPFGDVDGDQCGDLGGSPAATSRTFTNIVTKCQDNDLNGKADLQVLLTWSQNANQACGTVGDQSFPTVGSVSKCDFGIQNSTINVLQPLPILTLDKIVSNNFGGNNAKSSWTLNAAGPTPQNGAGGFGPVSVDPGAYTLTETPAANTAGYTAGTWSCSGTGFVPGDLVGNVLTLQRGDNISCSITNSDVRPGLTMVKTVNNPNGGNNLPASFNLRLTGTDGTHDSGVNYANNDTPVIRSNVQYSVTETPPAGYTLTSIECRDNSNNALLGGLNSPFSLNEGQNATCTFVNTDIAPALIVLKSVTGGEAAPGDFTLHVTGAGGGCGQDGTDDYKSGDSVTPVQSNCAYTVSEDNFPDYSQSGVACVITGTETSVPHPVTMNEGQSVTCTLSNQFVAPATLTVFKDVQNDDGGSAVAADFDLRINAGGGDCVEDGTTSYTSGDAVDAKDSCTYTVSEIAKDGYTQVGEVSCVDTNDGNAPVTHPVVNPDADMAVACTISNTDDGGMLALTKILDNTGGGTAVEEDWLLNAEGPTPKSGAGGFTSVKVNVSDTYTLSESGGPLGYTEGDWDCGDANGQLAGDVLTINNGDDISCSITNTAIRPTLVLNKIVINDNDGALGEGDFTIVLTGNDGTHGSGVDYSDSDTPVITAGVQYTVTEPPTDGYSLVGIVCTDTDTQVNLGSVFTPTLDQNISCEVTNDDDADAARFHVTKDFSDNNPGNVTVFLDCNTGLILDQDKVISEAKDVTFVVTSYDPGELTCHVYEAPVPAGYNESYAAGVVDGDAASYFSDAQGCHFVEVEGGEFYCEVINTLKDVEVIVAKEWIGEFEANGFGRFAKAAYTCFNVRQTPTGNTGSISGSLSFEGDSEDQIENLFPDFDGSSYCKVTEVEVDSAIEPDDSDCANVPVSLDSSGSCTIYNVLFLEGIPTLNQYGMALLALLMLGMGAVGFRRFT